MSALTRAHLDSHSNDPQAEVRRWIGSLQITVTTNRSRVSQGCQICRQAASVAWFRISRFWFTAVERKPPVREGRFFGPASARTSWLSPLDGSAGGSAYSTQPSLRYGYAWRTFAWEDKFKRLLLRSEFKGTKRPNHRVRSSMPPLWYRTAFSTSPL